MTSFEVSARLNSPGLSNKAMIYRITHKQHNIWDTKIVFFWLFILIFVVDIISSAVILPVSSFPEGDCSVSSCLSLFRVGGPIMNPSVGTSLPIQHSIKD